MRALKYGPRTNGPASLRLCVPTALPQEMRGPVVEIRSLSVPEADRRQGHASALMLGTTIEADLAQAFLFLAVEPESDTPTRAELAEFYARHGFILIQNKPAMLMVRPHIGSGIGGLIDGAL